MPPSLTVSAAPTAATKSLLVVPDRHLEMALFADYYPPELDDYWLEFRKIHAWEKTHFDDKPKARTYSKYFQVADLRNHPERIKRWIDESIERGYHVFCARNPVFDKKRQASRSWNVAWVVSFVIDLDGLTPQEACERVDHAKKDGFPEPSSIVATGHGTHTYVRPERPVSMAVAGDLLERFTTHWAKHPALAPYIDTRVKDPIRVLRCPGSVNYKDLDYSKPGLNLTSGLVCRILHHDPDCAHPLSAIIPGVQDADVYRGMEEEHADLARHHDAVMGWIKSERKAGRKVFIPKNIRTLPDAYRFMSQQDERKGNHGDDLFGNPVAPDTQVTTPVQHVKDGGRSSTSLSPPFLLSYGGTSLVDVQKSSRQEDTLARWDVFDGEKLEEFLANPKFVVPGEHRRNRMLPRVIAQARKRWDYLPVEFRIMIHDEWWERNKTAFSGEHTKEDSLEEFLYCWENLPQTFTTNEEFIAFVLSSLVAHPHADLLAPQAKVARCLAGVLYTGSMLVGFSPDRFYMSRRIMAKALEANQRSIKRALRNILGRGLVEITKPGDRVNATYYSVPLGMRGYPASRE